MGPGTRIVYNIINRIYPNSYTDAIAVLHDVDYLAANDNLSATIADLRAISRTDSSLQSWVMKLGLSLRAIFQLPLYNVGMTRDVTEVHKRLLLFLKTDPGWRAVMDKYGLTKYIVV